MPMSRTVCPRQQLRQLGDVGGDAAGFVAREQIGGCATAGVLVVICRGERLGCGRTMKRFWSHRWFGGGGAARITQVVHRTRHKMFTRPSRANRLVLDSFCTLSQTGKIVRPNVTTVYDGTSANKGDALV